MTQTADRHEHEIAHGRLLAAEGAEAIWGWGSPAGQRRAERRGRLIAEGGRLRPGAKVLEIGCGTGLFTASFAESGASLLGVDISEELLALARQRGLPPDRVRFLAKPFEACDVDGPFDAIVGSSILHHLDLVASLPKILNLLVPGGWISFAEPNMLNPQIFLQKNIPWIKARLGDSPDETAFVRWTLARQLRAAGFVEIAIRPYDWLHPATPRFLIPLVDVVGRTVERIPVLRECAGSLIITARRADGPSLVDLAPAKSGRSS